MKKEIVSKFLIKEISEAEKEIKDEEVSPSFNNAEDAIKWLNDKNIKYKKDFNNLTSK
ncbi:MAG: hypothetical protein WC386_01760 [Candidatus Paceibacterota bacterium]|jgi:hypothetical protein